MRELKDNVMKLAETFGKDYLQVIFAEVKNVDESERTCTVVQISGDADTEIPDVKLLAESNDGFLRIPKIGSVVVIADTKNNEPFVLMFSDCEKIYSIQNIFQFNDGSFGGLVKIEDLVTKINNIETKVNSLITTLKTVEIPLAPSGTYLLAADFGSFTNLTPTQVSDLENPKITHG